MSRITNNKGVTVPLALLFFIVCAVIGSIILATGTVASNRVGSLVSQQQTYYTTTSAAKLMQDILEDTSCELVATEKPDGTFARKATAKYASGTSQLPQEFLTQVEKVYQALETNTSLANQALPVQINVPSASSELSDLALENQDGQLTISSAKATAFNLTLTFKKEIKGNAYQCQLVAPASVHTVEEIVWYDASGNLVQPADVNLSNPANLYTQKTKKITTITWPKATIKQTEVSQ